jgi:F1F0 ATPase subunit 2
MTVTEAAPLLLAGAAGLVLGAIFFGGLWWTVRSAIFSQWPALWFLSSLLLRTSIVLTGFYLVSGSHWERLLSCLVGFTAARIAVAWLTRPRVRSPSPRAVEGNHAP